MSTDNRGLGSDAMDPDTKRTIQSMGGQTSRSGSASKNSKMSPSEAGKLGAAAEPTEAKQKGGRNSHRNR